MQAIEETFFYEVTAAEKKRIDRYSEELAAKEHVKDFIVFETSDRVTTVIVRGREVKLVEWATRARPIRTNRPLPFHMKVYVRNKPSPLFVHVHEPSDASWFVTALDGEPSQFTLFWPAVDSSGEIFTIPASDIILAEIDSAILDEGLRQLPRYKSGE